MGDLEKRIAFSFEISEGLNKINLRESKSEEVLFSLGDSEEKLQEGEDSALNKDIVKENVTLRLPVHVKKEIKIWCVQNNITMSDLLVKGYRLLSERTKE